ncbi:hypothetical protein GWO43_24745 [candidate division KSB1 bacterium]|nr:hypothetical protein [candidate division KSB1 bacterium]NIR68650.1 hypothetical protein [candidate division KSB1 bacterium]NIS27139.1 hypothetical protein [candidate division KSB1 bacterium]NIT74025.1 hypothetical protein [candidate division KSB1 bacterium]NIU27891.1 hypothetical protein [candidate division KSB1 bacterium]
MPSSEMGSIPRNRFSSYLVEIGKWALVIWLVWPVTGALRGSVEFGRVAIGIGLFVVFAGKLLYDVVIFPRHHERKSTPGKDLFTMVAIVAVVALIACCLIFFVAMYIINYMNAIQN